MSERRCIKDPLSSIVLCEIHAAAEDSTECNIFSEEQNRLIRSKSNGQRIIDGLEEVHPLGRIIADFGR